MRSNQYRAIILDFDGVVVESNAIKDEAFAYVFRAYPKHLKEILSYHHSTTAIRFDKFKYVYKEILKLPYSKEIEDHLGREFSDFCVDRVSSCPEVPGASEFLECFHGVVPMYLVTINPKKDLDIILDRRGLTQFFKGVYPVSGNKASAIGDILMKEEVAGPDAVFIGDSQADAQGAYDAGVDFIGRRSQMQLSGPKNIFSDMKEVLGFLKGRVL